MSLALLERGAAAFGPLLDEVAFVGGATIALWVTDPAAPPPRPTKDVDVVVEVSTRTAFDDFHHRLRSRGFREDVFGGVICRWRYEDRADDALRVDVMPSEGRLLGFDNPWQRAGLPHAQRRVLPSGTEIRALTPPYLVATKLAAYASRGDGDHLGSRDLEDIIMLVDGRGEIIDDFNDAPSGVREFVATQVTALLGQPRFIDAIFGFLRPDAGSQGRAESVVLPRLRAIAGR